MNVNNMFLYNTFDGRKQRLKHNDLYFAIQSNFSNYWAFAGSTDYLSSWSVVKEYIINL